MSSSGAAASDLDAALALLSGPDLVAHLRATCRRADYDAAARVLGDRDRRLAQVEDELAEARTGLENLGAKALDLEERCLALKAEESRGPSSSSSGGAIAAAAPRVDRRAEEPGPKGAIDLRSSSDDDELEEGEFRPDVAGVSCKRKESVSKGDEGGRAGDSCKQKESACSADDEDDEIPLSQLIKKRRIAKPGANGEPKKGHRDVRANSAGPFWVDGPVISPVNSGIPDAVAEHMVGTGSGRPDDPKVAVCILGTGNGKSGKNGGLSRTMPSPPPTRSTAGNSQRKNCSKPDGSEGQARIGEKQGPLISPVNRGIPGAVAEHMVGSRDDPKVAAFLQGAGNGKSGKNAGLPRTMPSPPPTGSTAGNSPRKHCSKPDGSEGRARIGEKQGPVAGPENDAPVQVRTPSVTDTAKRIVGSARVGDETPMEHTYSSSDGTNSMVLKSIQGQEKAIGVHKTKVSLETNGTGDKASMVLKDTREQGKPDGRVLHTKMLSRTDEIREQVGKLSPCQSRLDTHGGRPTTSDKPVSATLQQKNQLGLHSEQMSVESSLPSEVTGHWKSSSDVLFSCVANKELCMQAACALHRQKKFITQGGITKFDAHRAAVLVEFLLDGNLQGPLKKTAEDLVKHDSTGHDFLERVIVQCCEQLFSIYKNKDDKYFR